MHITTMDTNITERIQRLISEGETETAISELTEWAKAQKQPEWVKLCILVRARWELLQKESSAGTLEDEDLYRQTNQINSAVLDLLNFTPVEQASESEGKKSRKVSPVWVALTVLGFLVIAVLVYRQTTQSGKAPVGESASTLPSENDGSPQFSWPEGKTTRIARGDNDIVTYEVMSASIEPFDSQNNKLTLSIRCSIKSRYSVNFWDGSFRFQVLESVLVAPQSGLNELVEGNSYKDGVIWFLIPKNVSEGQLNITVAGSETQLPVAW